MEYVAHGTIKGGEILKADNLGIYNFDLVKILKEELKYSEKFNIPIILRNDAKCAAIAEKKIGSLKNCDDALFLTIGTGIGGAYFYNGKLVEPKRFSGFEVGHTIIEMGGNLCGCGNRGCFEAYGSISALKSKVKEAYNIDENITGKELIKIINGRQEEEGRERKDE